MALPGLRYALAVLARTVGVGEGSASSVVARTGGVGVKRNTEIAALVLFWLVALAAVIILTLAFAKRESFSAALLTLLV